MNESSTWVKTAGVENFNLIILHSSGFHALMQITISNSHFHLPPWLWEWSNLDYTSIYREHIVHIWGENYCLRTRHLWTSAVSYQQWLS